MRTFHSGGIAGAQGDITQGLPRVEELLNVRPPRTRAILSEIEGIVQILPDESGVRVVNHAHPGADRSYCLPAGQRRLVESGQRVTVGSPLCAGGLDPRELLLLRGRAATADYLVSEVQQVYRNTGVY